MTPDESRVGDHGLFPWSPIVSRPVFTLPGKAHVGLCAIVVLESIEWGPLPPSTAPRVQRGGLGARPYPDIARVSHNEYGLRVGAFRVFDALQAAGVPLVVALDATTAERCQALVDHCRALGAEFVAHGTTGSRMITAALSEDQERAEIESTLERLELALGQRPAGWLGVEYGESVHTPRLLAESGMRYVCDWVNDEQPFMIETPAGDIVALPLALELDDAYALDDRGVPVWRYRTMIEGASDRLVQDAANGARVLVLGLHPWLIGQAFRIVELERALEHVTALQGVRAATALELVEWWSEGSSVDGQSSM